VCRHANSARIAATQYSIYNISISQHYMLYSHLQMNEMGGTCSAYGEKTGVYMVLVGKPGGKRPLARPMRSRWEENY